MSKYHCSCWLCTSSKEKKAIAREKETRYYRDKLSKGRTRPKNKNVIYTAANGSI